MIGGSLLAQSSGVAINKDAPDASAALDIQANDRGILLPRVADVSAIAAPAEGLIVFDNSIQQFQLYTPGGWEPITTAWKQEGSTVNSNGKKVSIGSDFDYPHELTVVGDTRLNDDLRQEPGNGVRFRVSPSNKIPMFTRRYFIPHNLGASGNSNFNTGVSSSDYYPVIVGGSLSPFVTDNSDISTYFTLYVIAPGIWAFHPIYFSDFGSNQFRVVDVLWIHQSLLRRQ